MSITFGFHTEGPRASETFCNHTCPIPGGCDEQQLYFYCDHMHEATEACHKCALRVNLSNSNAEMVLERLGIPFDYCGTVAADDMLGRALVANVGRDDTGAAPTEDTYGHATIVECGVPEGYYENVMGRLVALATEAKFNNFDIGWS